MPLAPDMFRVAMYLKRDRARAEDLVQETLTRALEKSGSLQSPAALRSWLFRIAHNATVDHYPFEAASLEKGSDAQRQMASRYAPAVVCRI